MSTYGAKEMAAAFRLVRKNTVQIAEEIPEDKYGFVAAPGVRTVGTLLTHMVFAPGLYEDIHRTKQLSTLKGYDFMAFLSRAGAEEKKSRSKAEIVGLLKGEGERLAAWLDSLTPAFLAETYTDVMGQNPKTRVEGLLSFKEHEMHHRGQLMLIERMLGITPHLTRQMEERHAARAAAGAAAGAASGAAAAAAG
jgi:uncharacterized damage-inducible protein DinB